MEPEVNVQHHHSHAYTEQTRFMEPEVNVQHHHRHKYTEQTRFMEPEVNVQHHTVTRILNKPDLWNQK